MSDRLEDFVRQNKEQFDVREPDPSLWLKISPPPADKSFPPADKSFPQADESATLTSPVESQRKTLRWLRVAAAIALIFAGSSAGIWFLSGGAGEKDHYADELVGEIMETEAYYTRMVSDRYQELQPYLLADPMAGDMLKVDMEELDQAYADLKEDLKDDVANPAVIEAMILNYSVKLEILEDLLYQLKEKEDQDEKDDSYAL